MSLRDLEFAIAGAQSGESYAWMRETSETPAQKETGLGALLERLGFQKYLFILLFTSAAFGLTVGAYTYEKHGGLSGPAFHFEDVGQGGAVSGDDGSASVRRPVSQVYLFPVNRFNAGKNKGISFFDITGADTVKTAGQKLESRGFALSPRDTDDCRFAYLTGGEALRDVSVVDRILRKNDACCDVSGEYRKQLEVYNFSPAAKGKNPTRDSLRGALVFSSVSGELLAVYVKVRQSGEGAFEAVARRMTDEYGQPVRIMSGASYWERSGSLLSLAAGGGDVAVSVLHAANIDRHAERLLSLVEQRKVRDRHDAGKYLAEARKQIPQY